MSKQHKNRPTKVYTEEEMMKVVNAFFKKYNDLGCDGWPYEPVPLQVYLVGVDKIDEHEK